MAERLLWLNPRLSISLKSDSVHSKAGMNTYMNERLLFDFPIEFPTHLGTQHSG